jgi:hypothetical protein
MHRRVSGLGVAVVLLFAFGCTDHQPARYPVKGSVRFNGQPVESGEILFAPVDKRAAPDVGRIDQGLYEALVKGGKKRVEIRASRPVVGGKPNPMGPVYHDYIPEKYNARTKLTADVKPDGENRFDFELKSGKE